MSSLHNITLLLTITVLLSFHTNAFLMSPSSTTGLHSAMFHLQPSYYHQGKPRQRRTIGTNTFFQRRESSSKLNLFYSSDHRDDGELYDDDDDDENKEIYLPLKNLETARIQLEKMMQSSDSSLDNPSSESNDNHQDVASTTVTTTATTTSSFPSSSSSNINTNNRKLDNLTSHKLNYHSRNVSKKKNIFKVLSSLRAQFSTIKFTESIKEQRVREIQLLSTLIISDDAISKLKALWTNERGPIHAKQLSHASRFISMQSYNEAENILLSLIGTHGIHWVEPIHRLATLYYMQGRYEDAGDLLSIVLEVKPWHFDALSSMMLVCTITKQASGARIWSHRRLPPLHVPPTSPLQSSSASPSKDYARDSREDTNGSPSKDLTIGDSGGTNFYGITKENNQRFLWTREAVENARDKLYNDSRFGSSVYDPSESMELRAQSIKMAEQFHSQHTYHDHADTWSNADAWQ